MFVAAFGALFAIMNPFINLPVFLSLTDTLTVAAQRRAALRVTLSTAVFALVVLLGGSTVLGLFGLEVDDFRVAGGIVLMMIALGMLNGGSPVHTGNKDERRHAASQPGSDIAFYPMTFPILVGPGTITTLILLGGRADSLTDWAGLGAALAALLVILGVVLYFAGAIGHHLSQTLRVIMTRLMGMILAAIAVEMFIGGLKSLLPGPAG